MNKYKDKGRALVTGGTGFLGAHIIRQLVEEGWSVRAIRRGNALPVFIPATIHDKVEWVAGDILDIIGLQESMKGMAPLVHPPGPISFSKRDRHELYQPNL